VSSVVIGSSAFLTDDLCHTGNPRITDDPMVHHDLIAILDTFQRAMQGVKEDANYCQSENCDSKRIRHYSMK